MKNIAIILAGGSGGRFNNLTPKQFLYLKGKRIIDYSITTFNNHKDIDDIYLDYMNNNNHFTRKIAIMQKNIKIID